jgi:hypothetical protein
MAFHHATWARIDILAELTEPCRTGRHASIKVMDSGSSSKPVDAAAVSLHHGCRWALLALEVCA